MWNRASSPCLQDAHVSLARSLFECGNAFATSLAVAAVVGGMYVGTPFGGGGLCVVTPYLFLLAKDPTPITVTLPDGKEVQAQAWRTTPYELIASSVRYRLRTIRC